MTRTRKYTLLALAAAAALSCSVNESGTIALLVGADDPFTEADATAPTSLVISAVTVESAGGTTGGDAATILATEPYEGAGSFTLPGQDGFDVDILQANFLDSADASIIFGRTIPVQLDAIQNGTLGIFVQRTGQFARLPSPFDASPPSPLALPLEGRYVLIADGSGKKGALKNSIYDMSSWSPLGSPLPLPCSPLSIAPLGGTLILVVCAAGTTGSDPGCSGSGVVACGFDTSNTVTTQKQTAPAGCGWDSVAGGATVLAPNGDAFLVGGTRTGSSGLGASQCVIRVGQSLTSADGGFASAGLSATSLLAPRQGAAAAWSSKYGLVIAGGNQSSSDPPVETLGPDSDGDGGSLPSSTVLHGYSVGDLARGSGIAVHDGEGALVLAGGTLPDGSVAGVRTFSLSCAGDCDPEAGADSGGDAGSKSRDGGKDSGDGMAEAGAPSVPLASAQGFAVSSSSALFVGPAAKGGATEAFLVTTAGTNVKDVSAAPLRVGDRKGTTALWSPVSSVVVVGGDTTIESFVP